MIVLSAKDVAALLPMNQAIELVEKAMVQASAGEANLPLRSAMDVGAPNLFGIMPGALNEPSCYGIKLISLYPGNPAKGYSSHLGMMVLFESEFGTPVAIIDAGVLTAVRTSAASVVATRLLARKEARSLAVIGTGEQARHHIEAMLEVRDIKEIRIAGRTPKRAQAFVESIANDYPNCAISASKDVETAAAGADIICTVTSSRKTVLEGAWVGAGCHVNAVGASIPSMREIDEELIVKSSLWVDYRPSAMAQAGDIIAAIDNGRIKEDHIIGEIGEVLSGSAHGRQSGNEITLYRSLGIAAQDLICAHHVMREAKVKGRGTEVEFG